MANTPTPFEQAMLEHVNQARMDPAGQFDMMIADAQAETGVQGNITNAIRYFGVDTDAFRTQMAAFEPVAPLAWNAALATAAKAHSQGMIAADSQTHNLPGEASLGARITDAGYNSWRALGENIFAYTQDPLHGHAGFMIDWGYDDADFDGGALRGDWQSIGDGIQDAAGHRKTIMSANYVDIGIGAIAENDNATAVGPWVVTQDFGAQQGTNPAHLLGVFIDDADADGFYDIGEGLGGVTVSASGSAGTFSTITWASGGYQMELPAGSYTVRFTAPGFDGSASFDVTMGTQNVKQDATTDDLLTPEPGDPALIGTQGNDVLMGDGLQAVYFPAVSAQVYRLYQATLGREPDNAGHLAWTGRIAVDGRAAEDVAQGFVGSSEFQARFGGLDDSDFVTLLYSNVLGRAPEASGLAHWTGHLANGASRAEVVLGFSDSVEFTKATAQAANAFTMGNSPMIWADDVYRLYQATLDRAPDLVGFENWSARLGSGTSFQEVANGFVNSAEFKATYSNLDNGAFVDLLYQNVLDRKGDATGVATWTARLDGGMSRAEVVQGFSQSAEFVRDTAADVAAWVRAQGVDDIISGGGGNDLLAGGGLSDTFVFNTAPGNSTILDLELWDTLDLSAMHYGSLAAARADFSQQGADVVFDNGDGSYMTLLNTDLGMLSDDMFLI